MSLKDFTQDEIAEMSMIELAHILLEESGQPIGFYELLKRIGEIKGLSQEVLENRMAQFYTDLNIDGRFVSAGENNWGLREWYPIDTSEEEIAAPVKKKRKKLTDDDDFIDDDYELDDEDYDLDADLDDDLDEDLDDQDLLDDDLDDDLDDEDLDDEDDLFEDELYDEDFIDDEE